jgi:signal transduction histidine kinase
MMIITTVILAAAVAVLGILLRRTHRDLAVMRRRVGTREDQFMFLAHELKTPLALVRASTELLLSGTSGAPTETQRSFLSEIEEATDRIGLLTDNILTESRIEIGVFQPTFMDYDVRRAIREVAVAMRRLADRRNQRISLEYPQMLRSVSADPMLIRQAITNLVQNAIRHTSEGGTVMVSTFESDSDVVVAVWDDGSGMSPAERKRAFDQFVSHSGGTGLGLTIVQTIAALHGGAVRVDTSLGRGAAFLLVLPSLDHG